MPAVSKAQQKFMGMVHATQKGDMESPSSEVSKAADSISDKDAELKVDEMSTTASVQGYDSPNAFTKRGDEKRNAKRQADLTGYSVVKENRWLELKKEDSSATSKIGKGISNINKQLAEMERFLNWYGKLKAENGVTNGHFWKRTNSNIYKIKERLIKLEQQVRKISE